MHALITDQSKGRAWVHHWDERKSIRHSPCMEENTNFLKNNTGCTAHSHMLAGLGGGTANSQPSRFAYGSLSSVGRAIFLPRAQFLFNMARP